MSEPLRRRVVQEAQGVLQRWTDPQRPLRDHASAEQARRDDLARDVARLWAESKAMAETDADMREKGRDMEAALDRLAAAYLPDGPQDTPG